MQRKASLIPKSIKTMFWTISLSLGLSILTALSPSESAPNFKAMNQNGTVVQLSDLKGKYVLLYFYPKDETPGCTKQACLLRDHFAKFKNLNTVIFGISKQDQASHLKFQKNHQLPFDLLDDSDGKIGKAFGIQSFKTKDGSELYQRVSYLIGPDGKIVKFFPNVDPASHADRILAEIKPN